MSDIGTPILGAVKGNNGPSEGIPDANAGYRKTDAMSDAVIGIRNAGDHVTGGNVEQSQGVHLDTVDGPHGQLNTSHQSVSNSDYRP
jgi:hypothetical protein